VEGKARLEKMSRRKAFGGALTAVAALQNCIDRKASPADAEELMGD